MVEAALEAGVPCSWVLGDSVDGCDKSLRVMLESREKPYVLAVRSDEKLTIDTSFKTRLNCSTRRLAAKVGTCSTIPALPTPAPVD
jgi:SRSO17 transposase